MSTMMLTLMLMMVVVVWCRRPPSVRRAVAPSSHLIAQWRHCGFCATSARPASRPSSAVSACTCRSSSLSRSGTSSPYSTSSARAALDQCRAVLHTQPHTNHDTTNHRVVMDCCRHHAQSYLQITLSYIPDLRIWYIMPISPPGWLIASPVAVFERVAEGAEQDGHTHGLTTITSQRHHHRQHGWSSSVPHTHKRFRTHGWLNLPLTLSRTLDVLCYLYLWALCHQLPSSFVCRSP